MIYYITVKRERFPSDDDAGGVCAVFDSRHEAAVPKMHPGSSIRRVIQQVLNEQAAKVVSIYESQNVHTGAKEVVVWLEAT